MTTPDDLADSAAPLDALLVDAALGARNVLCLVLAVGRRKIAVAVHRRDDGAGLDLRQLRHAAGENDADPGAALQGGPVEVGHGLG